MIDMILNNYYDFVESCHEVKKHKNRIRMIENTANKEIREELDELLSNYDDSIKIKSSNILFENDKCTLYILFSKKISFDFIYYICCLFNFDIDYYARTEVRFII